MVLNLNFYFFMVIRRYKIVFVGLSDWKELLDFWDWASTIFDVYELSLAFTLAFNWWFGTGTFFVVWKRCANDIDWSTASMLILLHRSTLWFMLINRTASWFPCLHSLLLPELPLPCLAARSLNEKLTCLSSLNFYPGWWVSLVVYCWRQHVVVHQVTLA